jgi:hypothetical protein
MDSDDISKPDRLKHQVMFMNKNKDVAVLGTSYQIIDEKGLPVRNVIMPSSDKSIRRRLYYTNPICHPSVVFRKDIVVEAGGYLGGLHAEDYDLWSRLSLNKSIKFFNLQYIGLEYRMIGVGTARRSRWAYASAAAAQTRNFLVGGGGLWFFSIFVYAAKLLLRSSRPRE